MWNQVHVRLLTERKPRAGSSYQSQAGKNPGGDIRSALVFRTEAQSWERPESPIMFAAKDLRGVEKAGSD